MGRKTPQGRAGKLIRPLTNRITNRFTNRDGLRLTTANLVVSNCSDESDQTKGKSQAVRDRVSAAIHALLKLNQRTDSPGPYDGQATWHKWTTHQAARRSPDVSAA